jgi:hypothetical protein
MPRKKRSRRVFEEYGSCIGGRIRSGLGNAKDAYTEREGCIKMGGGSGRKQSSFIGAEGRLSSTAKKGITRKYVCINK